MRALITVFTVALWVAVPQAQLARVTVTLEGPVFIRPGAETALKVLGVGTELKVLQEDAGWMQVEFNDPRFGRRVGWVETKLTKTPVDEPAPLTSARVEATVVADRPLSSPAERPPAGAATEPSRPPAKLSELFNEAKLKNPHIIVERLVRDIDEAVRKIRYPDWQSTNQGERIVQGELRKVLQKYDVHRDQQLFDRAFAYVRQYY